jgi:hypothetical protein
VSRRRRTRGASRLGPTRTSRFSTRRWCSGFVGKLLSQGGTKTRGIPATRTHHLHENLHGKLNFSLFLRRGKRYNAHEPTYSQRPVTTGAATVWRSISLRCRPGQHWLGSSTPQRGWRTVRAKAGLSTRGHTRPRTASQLRPLLAFIVLVGTAQPQYRKLRRRMERGRGQPPRKPQR